MPPTKDVKRAAVELWKASVSLKQIRAQLKIPERSLRRILDHAKKSGGAEAGDPDAVVPEDGGLQVPTTPG